MFSRLFYYRVFLFICIGGIKLYLLWLENYNLLHPEVVEAQATGYVEEQPLNGVLIWDEQVIYTPVNGVLTYATPSPHRVAKGEAMAAIDGRAIRAGVPGYFYPALDGLEEHWVYSRLWPEVEPLPAFAPAVPLENGAHLKKGAPLGKLVPQPQTLRCIAYLDRTPFIEQSIVQNSVIRIKTEALGKDREAEVLTYEFRGQKVKVYLALPFFAPGALKTRAFSCRVVAGNTQGVMVPDTAVITRDGKQGVFLVQGSVTRYTEVEGFPADEKNFFITKGALPGNRLIRHADKNKEGVIRLW